MKNDYWFVAGFLAGAAGIVVLSNTAAESSWWGAVIWFGVTLIIYVLWRFGEEVKKRTIQKSIEEMKARR